MKNFFDEINVPAPQCYYADWDPGVGQGLIVLEDLVDRGGKFGHSTQHAGVDGVATALSVSTPGSDSARGAASMAVTNGRLA